MLDLLAGRSETEYEGGTSLTNNGLSLVCRDANAAAFGGLFLLCNTCVNA